MKSVRSYESRALMLLRGTALVVLCSSRYLGGQTVSDTAFGSLPSEKNTVVAAEQVPVLWSEPTDITSRDLRYGEGGKSHAPQNTMFAFVKEDLSGTNPKYIVTDPAGVKWKVKLGAEAKPEVAATRLVWAVGFHTNEDYYLPEVQITGLPATLHRGQHLFTGKGTAHDARLQRMDKQQAKEGSWSWKHDPFVGTREWNGLRVMMALINNWDLKDENNKVVVEKGSVPTRETYFVSDLGASFGTTGIVAGLYHSRGNLGAFRASKFVTRVTPGYVDFATPSRATFLEIFNPGEFYRRLQLRWIGKRVPRSEVKWMSTTLAHLTPDQIKDAFRSAGYSTTEVEGFEKVVEKRIATLSDL